MKILIDMNLSPSWVPFLAGHGFEAVHWASVGSASAADSQILAYAEANAYVIFTHDLDFGALLAARKTRCSRFERRTPCPKQSEMPSSAPSILRDLTSKQVPSSQWIAYGTESECCLSEPTNKKGDAPRRPPSSSLGCN